MENMWDRRFAGEEFAYGTRPNRFLSNQLEQVQPGKLLLPGEGEGRNAVHAAGLGWKVEAFDMSSVGRDKALAWAEEKGLSLSYQHCELREYDFGQDCFDAVGLVYFHLPPRDREYLHTRVTRALKPGGRIILQAFHTSQLGKGSGGPQHPDFLFDRELLLRDFAQLDCLVLEEVREMLDEGAYHQGEAGVINFVGQKKTKLKLR